MQQIWQDMWNILEARESFVSATIFDQSGSAPRRVGAKMAVKADGTIYGTVGGGRLEGETRTLAGEVFQTQLPQIQSFALTGADAAQMDMICGGSGEVLIDYVDAQDGDNLEIYRRAKEVMAGGGKAWLITALGTQDHNRGMRQRCLVLEDGNLIGHFNLDGEFVRKLVDGPAKISIHTEVLEDIRILVEPIRNAGTLYIFGAGHVSQQIAPVAEMVGFQTVVLDDRPEYANRERFPKSDLMVLPSWELPLPELSLDGGSYLAIVTRGHLHDKNVLGQVLRSPVAYIGMIGSKRKRDLIYQSLEEEGFGKEELAKVHSPIGLEILAETPEEIAISIVAELIKVRAEREQWLKKTSPR